MRSATLNTAEDFGANVVSPWVDARQDDLGGGYGVFAAFSRAGQHLFAGTARGTVLCRPVEDGPGTILKIDASPLCFARIAEDDLLIGTDQGRVLRLSPDGAVQGLHDSGHGWIEQLAVSGDDAIAIAADRKVQILDASGRLRLDLGSQPSTPSGLAFDGKGKRLAVAHYDGVSIWNLKSARKELALKWHGSHTLMRWSPDGSHIATATQDKELHAWRMPKGKSLKMSGYPSKIRSLSWTPDGAYLACAGADTITCWCFTGGGPIGTAPLEFGYVFNSLVTQVAAHPQRRFVAGGYDNGSVLVGSLSTCDAIIAKSGGAERITGLAWSPLSDTLAAVDANGMLIQMDFAGQAFESC